MPGRMTATMASSDKSQQRTCGYVVPNKKRPCRMLVKSGKRFCGEHAMLEEGNGSSAEDHREEEEKKSSKARMPCPYDPNHSCFVSQLEKHLAKCNARPKPQPEYICKDINMMDAKEEEVKISLGSLTDEELLGIIRKVSKIHAERVGTLPDSFGRHDVLDSTLSSLTESRGSYRHVYQNSAILFNMSQAGILTAGDSTTYVEFGSGRGQLGYVLGQAVNLETDSLLMIDRSSPRHKHENRFKTAGKEHPSIHRIRADIADVDLGRVPHVQRSKRLVGTGKHLCGAATDLALHCLSRANQTTAGLVQGVCIALCCHHQCTWRHYVGKEFFKEMDLTGRDFAVMRAMTSWATCGARLNQEPAGEDKKASTGRSEEEHDAPPKEDGPPGRYAALGLDPERREEIGRQCKQVMDQGRVAYLSGWLQEARLVHYVETDISLENVLLLASSSSSSP